ncbi:MAG: HAMP domain-containing histidine kinase [Bacteroidia bacterium]|nr:HAMP domain-containing histidine kinase [Bacteroidia bacterium]MDW8301054.1 HAMP domain-containing sensor histidine kinase [Bacteroidia bacterium]
MKKMLWLYWALLWIGLGIAIFLYVKQKETYTNLKSLHEQVVQNTFTEIENKGLSLLYELCHQQRVDTLLLPYYQPVLFEKINKIEDAEKFYVYVLDYNHRLIAWNTNEYMPTNAEWDTQIALKKPLTVTKKNIVYYSLVGEITSPQQDIVGYVFVVIPLCKKYSIENTYIQSYSIFDDKTFQFELVSDTTNISSIPIYNRQKEYVISVQAKIKTNQIFPVQEYFTWSVFAWIACLLLVIHYTLKQTHISRFFRISILTVIIILTRYAMIYYHFPQKYYTVPLFSPTYYASSIWSASLGDLLINTILGLWLTFEWYYTLLPKVSQNFWIEKKTSIKIAFLIGIYLTFVAVTWVYQQIVRSVIIHSNIRFDFTTQSPQIDIYTGIAILSLMLIFICIFLIQYSLIGIWISLYNFRYAILLILAHIVVIGLNFWVRKVDFYLLAWVVPSYFLTFSYIRYHTEYKQKLFFTFNHSLMLILIFSINLTLYLNFFTEEKQRQEQIQFTLRKAKQHDEVLESLFSEISEQIKKDAFVSRFIADSSAYTPALIQKIERLITNITQYYTCDIAITDANHKVLYNPKNNILRVNEKTTLKKEYKIQNELYFIPYNREFIENLYVGIIPFTQGDKTVNIHIEFVPNAVYQNGLYPNFLVDRKQQRLLQRVSDKYSYAVYYANQLVSMQGSYDYSFQNNICKTHLYELQGIWQENKPYLHYIYCPEPQKIIIVTRKLPDFIERFALFSYIIYAWGILLLVLSLPYWIKHYTKRKGLRFNLYYRTKIQVYLLLMSLIPLLIIGLISIPFIKKSYLQEVQRELKRQTQAVLAAIQAKHLSEQDFIQYSTTLQNLVSDISILTQSDVNLYSKQGKLVVSTQPKIFELGLLSTTIHPKAYFYLNMQYQQEYIQNERIGKISYISIYVPVIDKDLNMLGVLNMPYITRQGQLDAEVARFISYLISIYVIILLLLSGLALVLSRTLTHPLNVLKQRIEQIRLGRKNEKMEWKSNDEIGALVDAYNQMVEKLEISERKLAMSEREAAWREMARQIAHEIKNPLTPMKLSVQHLLRAYQDKHPNLSAMIQKTAQTLLTEIDSLTEIATSFSNFAKLQQQEPEIIEVQKLLKQNIALYQNHKEITFEVQMPQKPCFIYADASAISRTFQNLIKNAVQAMESSPKKVLSISLESKENLIQVTIKDTGCGIDPEHLEHIFEPNFTTKSSGTGLGLAISKRAIENAGGSISVQSQVNIGTTFYITLPAYRDSFEK